MVLGREVKYRIGNFSIPFLSSFQNIEVLAEKEREIIQERGKQQNYIETKTTILYFSLLDF